MLAFPFPLKLDWGSYTVSIAKTASKKIETLFLPWSFFLSFYEVDLYLYISTVGLEWDTVVIHVWASAPGHYLDLLDKLQKPVRRTLDPSLAASLELLPISFL